MEINNKELNSSVDSTNEKDNSIILDSISSTIEEHVRDEIPLFSNTPSSLDSHIIDEINIHNSNININDTAEEIHIQDGPIEPIKKTPLPKMKLFSIFITLFCDAINSLSLFPYMNFMIEDFHLTNNEKELGYYVGVLASSYYIAQLFSSFFWGWFSNLKGRRPCLLLGLIGSMVCLLFFGFSKYYFLAIIFRFLCGLVNGNVAVAKTMLGEITDSTNQAKAFSFIGLSWSVGGIIAPLIGGLTSNVCTHYPNTFNDPNSFLCKHPYILPNFICILFSATGLVLNYFYLQESKTFTIKNKYSKIGSKSNLNLTQLESTNNSKLNQLKKKFNSITNRIFGTPDIYMIQLDDVDTKEKKSVHILEENNQDLYDYDGADVINIKKSTNSLKKTGELNIEEEDDEENNPRPLKDLYKDKIVIYACVSYAFLGLMFTMFDEVFPVWSPIPRIRDPETGQVSGGGFNFESRQIGILQSCAGAFALVIQLTVFPNVVAFLGLLKTYRFALLMVLPTWLLLPELSRFVILDPSEIHTHSYPAIFWVLLFPAYLCQSFASELTFIAIIVMISNSALPKDMALVNSIAQFLVSISRSIGPIMGSSILAFSVSHNLHYPLDFRLVFILMACLCISLFFASFVLPKSLDHTKDQEIKHQIKLSMSKSENLSQLETQPTLH
ncbi:hypothetical protein CYY_005551 [Polysphondylium violaceum]|uniref:Major facilitator superfamily (MFS) profile domain-containing protein n=1 Tax=Polysphondylium violaceum TaxID=133409 RepID=A0A8J4PSU3_9MYCE|nr:hypothetical protein CYY_005551 [Polysphondylium violaceum]